MNDSSDNKIDLSSTNKTTKTIKLPKINLGLKKQNDPKRDQEGKFASQTGSGGLSTLKKFNWRRSLPIIVLVALVGGFLVFQSFATNGNTEYVTNLYRTCLNRSPDPTGLKFWVDELNSNRKTPAAVEAYFMSKSPNGCTFPSMAQTLGTSSVRDTKEYKDAVKALWEFAMGKFWAAYNARGGQLGSSSTFPNLANSCREYIGQAQAGTRTSVPGGCFPLVGLSTAYVYDIDSYAVMIARGAETVESAIQKIMYGSTINTTGCDTKSQDFTDCYTNNVRNMLLGGESSRNRTNTESTSNPTRDSSSASTSTTSPTTTNSATPNNQSGSSAPESRPLHQRILNRIFNR